MATGAERTKGCLLLVSLVCVSFADVTAGLKHFKVTAVHIKNNGAEDSPAGVVTAGEMTQIELKGSNFPRVLQIGLTSIGGVQDDPCLNLITPPISADAISQDCAIFTLPPAHTDEIPVSGYMDIWVCVRARKDLSGTRARFMGEWVHLGNISKLEMIEAEELVNEHKLSERSAETVSDKPGSEGMDPSNSDNSDTFSANTNSDNSDTVESAEKLSDLNYNKASAEKGLTTSTVKYADDKLRTDKPSANTDDKLKEEGNMISDTKEMDPSDYGSEGSGKYDDRESHPHVHELRPSPLESATRVEGLEYSWPSDAESPSSLRVSSLRVEAHDKGLAYEDLAGSILVDTDADVRFFGVGFTNETEFLFTSYKGEYGTPCGAHTTKVFRISSIGEDWATATIQLPVMTTNQSRWYLCAQKGPQHRTFHQGSDPWLTMSSYTSFLPVWLQACFIALLLILSGIFSGLNLGLMALDKTELKILSNTGNPTEKKHAQKIEPVRAHGNYLLCTLLLGNVLVNSTLTILLDGLSTGLIAVIGSTIGIVIFGEIIPQAVCSRHGLAVGSRTVWLVRIFMVLTGPMSWPISKLLDCILGEEIGQAYDRDHLKELIKLTHDKTDIKAEEQKVICGALDLHRKTVREIMTKIRDVYMLSIDSSLDFDTINDIMQQGYSRVPVYEGDRTNIVSVLFIKDLAFIDPDDNTPLKTLCQFYQNPLNFVIEDTTLDVVMKDFKEGSKGHMAFVHKVNSEGDGDPFYEVVGVVTLEDVIEELIQEEIVDETDVFTDNRKRRRRQIMGRRDFTEFSQTGSQTNNKKVQISAQVQVAVFQYLRTTLEPFKEGQLSEAVVKRLIIQDIIQNIKVTNREESKSDPSTFIYTQGKPADYFVLIIEGYVEVVIGKEGLTFENGPFTYFGLAALPQVKGLVESPSIALHRSRGSIRSIQSLDTTKSSFVPDYSVRAVSDVLYLKISCSHYIAARRAFLLEQLQKEPCQETFEKELTKMLNEEVGEVSPLKDVKEVPHKETSALPNGTPVQAFNKDTSSDYIPTHPNLPNSVKKPKQMMETKLRELPTTVNTINVAAIDNDHSNSLENTLRENYEEESEDQTSTAL